ncbi:sulfur carrier protein ThiS adenylyltransferase ThiF, partial [Myxococcota bacterium]
RRERFLFCVRASGPGSPCGSHASPFDPHPDQREKRASSRSTLRAVVGRAKPEADLIIYNGCPESGDRPLYQGDEIVLIRRGEIPCAEELESLLVARHGPGVHAQLKRGRIGIAGCGGLGSTLATVLCRSGVGGLVIVDFDWVEPSNLNRQQFFLDQIGQFKVDALASNLSRINPYVEVERHRARLTCGNAADFFSGCDVVAECLDDPTAKAELLRGIRSHPARLRHCRNGPSQLPGVTQSSG